jgi:hypothetical protein
MTKIMLTGVSLVSCYRQSALPAARTSIVPGFSFQFGRASIRLFRAPHFAHFTLERNHGTGVSPG